jgi:hypothetical protein
VPPGLEVMLDLKHAYWFMNQDPLRLPKVERGRMMVGQFRGKRSVSGTQLLSAPVEFLYEYSVSPVIFT